MKKVLIILTILIIPFLLSGCYIKKTFTLEEYNEYLDNLKCGQSKKEDTLCNIKGKYEVVSNNIDTEEKVEYKIKGTDLTFTVEQTLDCDTIDGSGCFNKKDILSDNFTQKATDYHFKKYNESIGKTSCFKTYNSSDDCMYTYLEDVKTKVDLEDRITYLKGFINYANNIDYKFIRRYENFSFGFVTSDGKNEKIYIYIDIDDNNKYVYRTYYKDGDKPHLYEAEDGKLETFINNYMEAKGIILN